MSCFFVKRNKALSEFSILAAEGMLRIEETSLRG
jgi:hypothetical protein